MESKSGCPRGGAQRPHGALGRGRFAVRPAQGARPARGAGGGLTSPGKGSGQRGPPCRALSGGVGAMGPGMGGGARRSGSRGAAGAEGSAPAGVGQPRLCLSVSWLIRLSAPQGSGAVRSPGESAPRSPAAAAPGKRDRGAATRVFLVGLLASSRATGTLGDRSWELSKKPAPLPLSPPRPPPPSPIPERSSRSLAAWKARGQRGRAGDGGGGAAAGGRRVVLFGDGERAERERP